MTKDAENTGESPGRPGAAPRRFPWEQDTPRSDEGNAPASVAERRPVADDSAKPAPRRFPWEVDAPASDAGQTPPAGSATRRLFSDDDSRSSRSGESAKPAASPRRFPWETDAPPATGGGDRRPPTDDEAYAPRTDDGAKPDSSPRRRPWEDDPAPPVTAEKPTDTPDLDEPKGNEAPAAMTAPVEPPRPSAPTAPPAPPLREDAKKIAAALSEETRPRWVKPKPERLTEGECAHSRRLYRGRVAFAFSAGKQLLTISLASPRDLQSADAPTVQLMVRIGDNVGLLGLSGALVRVLLDSIGSNATGEHPDLDLQMEVALALALGALEQRLGRPVSLLPAGAAVPRDLRLLPFRVSLDDKRLGLATLRAAPSDAATFTELLDLLPPVLNDIGAVLLRVTVEAGSVILPVGTLRQLCRGDVLLSDESYRDGGAGIVIAGQRRLAAQAVVGGFQVTAVSDSHNEGMISMDDDKEVAGRETTLDDLAVRVVFEIGRRELPIAELQRIQPGYVVELERPDNLTVDLTVRGQVIGKGELVQVDHAIGVRILRLFGHE